MTYFRVGQFGKASTPQFDSASFGRSALHPSASAAFVSSAAAAADKRKSLSAAPLVEFSTDENRASLMSLGALGSASSSVLNRRRRRRGPRRQTSSAAGGRVNRRRRARTTRLRIVKGKVALRVGGQVQRLGASQLVRFVPLAKLRAAAKKVLGRGVAQVRRRRRSRLRRKKQVGRPRKTRRRAAGTVRRRGRRRVLRR